MDTQTLMGFAPFILVIVVFYFMLIRPQQKRDKAHRQLLSELAVGDSVVSVGGITGKVVTIKDDFVTIETGADKTKIKLQRWAVKEVEKPITE